MTVYTMPVKKHQKKQERDFFEKIMKFLEKHEKILITISLISLLVTGLCVSAAYGNPVTN